MISSRECPAAPVQANGSVIRCSMGIVETGSGIIKTVEQCSRCGWIDPASLDRAAEDWYKRRQAGSGAEMRTAMAISGEPFTFVRSSEADITLDEAIGQALGAASMCWEHPERAGTFNSSRAARIYTQLRLLLQEKALDDRKAIALAVAEQLEQH